MQTKKYFIIFTYCKRVLKSVSVKLIAYLIQGQQHIFLSSFGYLLFIANNYSLQGVKILFQDAAAISSYVTKIEWWNDLKMRRISSPSHIIWASDDLRHIQYEIFQSFFDKKIVTINSVLLRFWRTFFWIHFRKC